MKILVLSYEYPPIGGGGGVICKNISESLAKLGNEVTILTTASPSNNIPHQSDHREPHAASQTPHLIRLNARRKSAFESNPVEMLSWIRTTKKYIRDHPRFADFDICMAHFVLPGGEVARWMKEKYGLAYVTISHGHDIPWVHPRQMFIFHLLAYFRIKVICRRSSINFIQTRMMKENIDSFLGGKEKEKNIIIPNGVDPSRFFPDYGKRPPKLRIIFTGRLVSQKDPMTFLKAIRLFQEETRDFEVHILGDGRLRKKIERFVKKNGLSTDVKFLGKIPEEKMLEEYQSAHLMVAPSLSEGMSIAALEALSCGVYLIATRASGFEDMIRETENGEYINFHDPVELSMRITEFYRRNKREQSKTAAELKRLRGMFNWEKIAQDYLDFFGSRFK